MAGEEFIISRSRNNHRKPENRGAGYARTPVFGASFSFREVLIILLPETDRKTAVHVAERLRAIVAETPIKVSDREIPLTVSIGIATKDENTMDLETLIARADQAMYIAKHRGRNQVAVSK